LNLEHHVYNCYFHECYFNAKHVHLDIRRFVDEFQILQIYYDNKEMCEVILEMEQSFSSFNPKEEQMFAHICTDFYNENDEGMWQGRAVDTREVVVNNAERTQ
jgi:hypothetical protein